MSDSHGAYKAYVVKLTNTNYNQWKASFKNLLFRNKTGIQPDTLTRRATLDPEFFELHEDFEQEYARLVADDEAPDDPFSSDSFTMGCFNFAKEHGVGFKEWVYPVYSEIFDSLPTAMKEQVEADKLGDLVELLQNIDLALRRTELFSTSELKKMFFGLTMEKLRWRPKRHEIPG